METGTPVKVIVFTCSWNAHSSLQEAGRKRLRLPHSVRALRLDCVGQVSASVILTAFEKGAGGVMIVGCSPQECRYEFGSRRAADLFDEVRRLAVVLGLSDKQLAFHQVHPNQPEVLVDRVRTFVAQLAGTEPSVRKESA